MKKNMKKEFVIGVSVTVAIAILIFGIDYLKGINLFQPANFYVASYDNVAGLEVAAPVSVDGFKVGQVREIKFDYEHPGKIDVVLALNKELKIPEDSKAEIGSGLLNGAFVTIKLGSSPNMIPVGGEIEGKTTPDMMTSLSEELLPSVGRIVPKVDSLLLNLNKLVSDPALTASIQSLKGITSNLENTSKHLNGLMGRDVPVLMKSVSSSATRLDTIAANLSVLSAQLKALPLSASVENINALTGNLVKFSDQLNDTESTLGQLMNNPELYDRLSRVSADIDSLIVDIKKNPKRYISIKLL